MTQQSFEFGDRVRHQRRPEWGIGTVIRVEKVAENGAATQRLSIRFSNAGLKTLMPDRAPLERAETETAEVVGGDGPSLSELDRLREAGWLGHDGDRKIREVMVALPAEVRDPFDGPETRLRRALALYRFERTGRSLLDWAIAQSGLRDPLSRFTRHELEELFDRWVIEREAHLASLLDEVRHDAAALRAALEDAPDDGRRIVRRLTGSR